MTDKFDVWSFDLTDFGSPENFRRFLNKTGMSKSFVDEEEHDGDILKHFIWYNPSEKIAIQTSNNPLTGEYQTKGRKAEKGYASYMAILGDEVDELKEMTDLIKKYAEHIKAIATQPNYTSMSVEVKEWLDRHFEKSDKRAKKKLNEEVL